MNYYIPCKKSGRFSLAMNKLYIEYPEYTNKNFYFLANGNIIAPNKSISENKIKSGDTIILNYGK